MKVGRIKMMTLLAMISGQVFATTFFRVSDEKIIASAEHIITGNVEAIETVPESNSLFQYITIKVEKIYKTNSEDPLMEGDSIQIRQIGGENNGQYIKLDGLASFTVNSDIFVSLKKNDEGYFYVVGSNQGKFDVLNRREMIRDTTESMFVRQGENGKMVFFNGAVEKSSLEEMVTKIHTNEKE